MQCSEGDFVHSVGHNDAKHHASSRVRCLDSGSCSGRIPINLPYLHDSRNSFPCYCGIVTTTLESRKNTKWSCHKLACVFTNNCIGNSIIACLYKPWCHAIVYALFSIFFSSSRRLKRARSSQKIVNSAPPKTKARSAARRPAHRGPLQPRM